MSNVARIFNIDFDPAANDLPSEIERVHHQLKTAGDYLGRTRTGWDTDPECAHILYDEMQSEIVDALATQRRPTDELVAAATALTEIDKGAMWYA